MDAATRFWFAEEDELAIHTVAAAAYRSLRDLMARRGLQPFGEFVRAGFFSAELRDALPIEAVIDDCRRRQAVFGTEWRRA